MHRIFSSLVLLGAVCLVSLPRASAVTIATVPVGNPGNEKDDSGSGFREGAVPHSYRIGVFEVTNFEYAAFLNEKAKSDPLFHYNAAMDSDPRGGITRSGVSGSYTYEAKPNMGNKPVIHVSWYDAIRFSNWLHNGQGTGDTETGAYTLEGGTPTPSNGLEITRNPGATWFLPSADEWYKAAYHQPAAQGGDSDGYWRYPTASNTVPRMATANGVGDISNPGMSVANYGAGAHWNAQFGNLTTVGSAGPLSKSYYGTFDQGGNVAEWNEDLFYFSNRGVKGGAWIGPASNLSSQGFSFSYPENEEYLIGFRVATVPEPSALCLAAWGAIGLWGRRRPR
jgi:formylglycine-generating enzyme